MVSTSVCPAQKEMHCGDSARPQQLGAMHDAVCSIGIVRIGNYLRRDCEDIGARCGLAASRHLGKYFRLRAAARRPGGEIETMLSIF